MRRLNPAYWFGVAERRRAWLESIRSVREEHTRRVSDHGGEVSDLNERLAVRAERSCREVADLEKEVLS